MAILEDLMEVIYPFDSTMGSWLHLMKHVPPSKDRAIIGPGNAIMLAFGIYLEEKVLEIRNDCGKEACAEGLTRLFGVHDTLIRAGRLTGDPLVDQILLYAAHLAAMGSYGPAVWDRAARVMLAAQMTTREKELNKR